MIRIGFLKFLIDDLKSDFTTLKAIINGTAKSKFKFTDLFKDFDKTLKANWIMFLIIILAFTSGIFVGAKYYENKTNNIIITTFFPEDEDGTSACFQYVNWWNEKKDWKENNEFDMNKYLIKENNKAK